MKKKNIVIHCLVLLMLVAILAACASTPTRQSTAPTVKKKPLDFSGERTASQPVVNLARGKQARQSSTYSGDAGRAVDGNTDGNYFANSVSHTNSQPQDWWEVDLGAIYNIGLIKIWNRTDCCSERLSNFYIMVSERPFSSNNINESLAQSGVWNNHNSGTAGRTTEIKVNAQGRYVRIQLAGTNYLQLAEVEVFGN